jgi:hypothetical protein
MQLQAGRSLLFATDLTSFLGCRHLAALERLAAHGLARRPFLDDPMPEILRERGLEHERAYVRRLADSGRRIVRISRSPAAFFEPECRTPEQMRMANAFCRYLELARE